MKSLTARTFEYGTLSFPPFTFSLLTRSLSTFGSTMREVKLPVHFVNFSIDKLA